MMDRIESIKSLFGFGSNGKKITDAAANKCVRFLEKSKMDTSGCAEIVGYCYALCNGAPSVDYVLQVCELYAKRGLLSFDDIHNNIPLQETNFYPRKEVTTALFVQEMCNTTANMYRLGWDERNGGNVSYLLDEQQVAEYLDLNKVIRTIPLMGVNEVDFDVTPLLGKIFIVTGTGKYFKNVKDDPENNLGIVRIVKDGVELLWGFADGGRPTSEFPAHMMSHMARLAVDPEHRVVMHCHPTHTLAMNYVHELDERKFTHTLWEMCTECIVVFPDGVGILPWMLCGTSEIGKATANKMKDFRLVVWSMHGIYGAGKTLDETFGLIETVEKAAQIYILTCNRPRLNTITDAQLKQLAEFFKVDYRKDFLD